MPSRTAVLASVPMSIRAFAVLSVAGGIVAACGGASTPASALRPPAPTAAKAFGEASGTCATDGDAPLVVDWPSHRRAELEATLRSGGVLLARYDCKTLRVMPDCRANGGYAYQRVTLKEDVVRMSDADSIRARLPLAGAGLAAELEGSLARGSSLDLGLAIAGRWTTSTRVVYAPSLSNECTSATHFVRSVPVGAFAMSTGSKAKARAVAEIFEAGARAESESAHSHEVRDGDLAACRGGSDDKAPAAGCSAPLRVELAKIDPRSEQRAKCEDTGDMHFCGWWSNLVFLAGDGKPVDEPQARLVVAKLVELCRGGHAGACGIARMDADLFERWTKKKLADIAWLDERACEIGDANACLQVSQRLEEQGNREEAYRMLERACTSGEVGCSTLADAVEEGAGPTDPAQRRQYLADLRARACLHGTSDCDRYAELYRSGLRARGDFTTMKEILKLCEESMKRTDGSSMGCAFAAAGFAFGLGVPRDLSRAKHLYARVCSDPIRVQTSRGGQCQFPKAWGVSP